MQVTEKHLRYFKNHEFVREGRNWLPMYNPRLLILLDVFRHLTGPCILSPHPFALGRMSYPKRPGTLHRYDAEEGVRAIDVFPTLKPKHISISKDDEMWDDVYMWAIAEEWIYQADKIGFTGIGFYPQWTLHGEQRPGLHLDIRESPYQWGWVDGKQVPIEQALETL